MAGGVLPLPAPGPSGRALSSPLWDIQARPALVAGRRWWRCGSVIEVRQAPAGEAAAELALDAGQQGVLLGRDQHQCVAGVPGSPRAADAVNILFRGGGHVVVDDVGDVADV